MIQENNIIDQYYQKNREWIEKLALSGDPLIRTIALAILELGGERDEYHP